MEILEERGVWIVFRGNQVGKVPLLLRRRGILSLIRMWLRLGKVAFVSRTMLYLLSRECTWVEEWVGSPLRCS